MPFCAGLWTFGSDHVLLFYNLCGFRYCKVRLSALITVCGWIDTADAATKAVQEYLEQQVSSGNISQEEADDLLNNGSTE